MLSRSERTKVDAYRDLMASVYELAAVSRRDSESLARPTGVTVTQWHTMSVLSGGAEATVPQVAQRLGVTRQAVQRVVDQLLTDGSVAKLDNPHHEGSPLLRLTPRGADILQQLWERSDTPRATMLSDIDTASIAQATGTLRDLLQALKNTPR